MQGSEALVALMANLGHALWHTQLYEQPLRYLAWSDIKFGEAMDTVVREAVYTELEYYNQH